MQIELSKKEFRRLLDLVYIGNWILNSTRGDDRIADYEDTVFFDILAEELARRDMEYAPISKDNYDELVSRMEDYIEEFEAHGAENISVDTE